MQLNTTLLLYTTLSACKAKNVLASHKCQIGCSPKTNVAKKNTLKHETQNTYGMETKHFKDIKRIERVMMTN
jgi:hypothetical protein